MLAAPAAARTSSTRWPDIHGVPVPAYDEAEHAVWRTLIGRQRALWFGRACDEYLQALADTGLVCERIPRLADVSDRIASHTGWQLVRVDGIVPDDEFFAMLAARRFPSTDFIRDAADLDYTPAPDIFHDLVGHAPLLTHPRFAAFFQRFGEAGVRAHKLEHPARHALARLYWYTVEFGLIRTGEGLRIYGAGILSSHQEVGYSLSAATHKHAFDPDLIARTDYDVWHLQDELFVIDSFDALEAGFARWTEQAGLSG